MYVRCLSRCAGCVSRRRVVQKHRAEGSGGATTFFVECAMEGKDGFSAVLVVLWKDIGVTVEPTEVEASRGCFEGSRGGGEVSGSVGCPSPWAGLRERLIVPFLHL